VKRMDEPDVDEPAAEDLAAKLDVNPQYQSALRDAESESWDEPGTDVTAMIEAANERRRAARPAPPRDARTPERERIVNDHIDEGSAVIITDAFGKEYHTRALSGPERAIRSKFWIVWVERPVKDGTTERCPWPLESVRAMPAHFAEFAREAAEAAAAVVERKTR
jgi:hypothetical protein